MKAKNELKIFLFFHLFFTNNRTAKDSMKYYGANSADVLSSADKISCWYFSKKHEIVYKIHRQGYCS